MCTYQYSVFVGNTDSILHYYAKYKASNFYLVFLTIILNSLLPSKWNFILRTHTPYTNTFSVTIYKTLARRMLSSVKGHRVCITHPLHSILCTRYLRWTETAPCPFSVLIKENNFCESLFASLYYEFLQIEGCLETPCFPLREYLHEFEALFCWNKQI